MKTNKFNPVLETIPNKSSYSPSALFGHSIRMMLDNSANAEVQFQEPKDGGVLDVVISCSEGSRCQVVCHIQKDSLNIDFSAADEKAPASKAQFPAPVLRPEELKSVRIPTDEECPSGVMSGLSGMMVLSRISLFRLSAVLTVAGFWKRA